jgi:hypothetical protein
VSRPDDGWIKLLQRLCSCLYALFIRSPEMKASYHGIKLPHTRDLLGMSDSIDDAGVSTASDDN